MLANPFRLGNLGYLHVVTSGKSITFSISLLFVGNILVVNADFPWRNVIVSRCDFVMLRWFFSTPGEGL